ncbi:MAG: hypothetical protein AAF927_00890 [Bacteroidota bacterium]
MKKRIKIVIEKSPLDFLIRKEMIKIYKAAKKGERAYFHERLFDYPYYLLYWDQDKLVGFTGLEFDSNNQSNASASLILLGQCFLRPQYDEKALFSRSRPKILWTFWSEKLLQQARTSMIKLFSFKAGNTGNRFAFFETILLSKAETNANLHYYREYNPELSSSSWAQTQQIDWGTGFGLLLDPFRFLFAKVFKNQPSSIDSVNSIQKV